MMHRLDNLDVTLELHAVEQLFVGTRLFLCNGGAVTEEQVRRSIEQQEEGSGAFQVWDEPPPSPTEASSRIDPNPQ